jgi:hypothetical protein
VGTDSTLDTVLAAMFTAILPHLGERHCRLLCGAVARALGRGGVTRTAELAEVSVPTVIRGSKSSPYDRRRQAADQGAQP